jgi:hypothetical protein
VHIVQNFSDLPAGWRTQIFFSRDPLQQLFSFPLFGFQMMNQGRRSIEFP